MTTYVFGGLQVQPALLQYISYELSEDIQLSWPYAFRDAENVVAIQMDCTPSDAGFNFILPNATETGVGTSFFFRNIGSDAFGVNDYDDALITNIDPGEIYYFYLTDNSTEAGTWSNFIYGAGSSSADADQLAGYGLISLPDLPNPNTLNTFNEMMTKSSDFPVTNQMMSSFIVCTSQLIITLMTGIQAGLYFSVFNNSNGIVSLDPDTCELNGSTDMVDLTPGQSIYLTTDGTNWFSLGINEETPSTVDEVAFPLSAGTYSYTLPLETLNSYGIIYFTGTIDGNVTVDLPLAGSEGGQWTFHHKSSASSETITVQISGGGSSFVYNPNDVYMLYYNVTDGNLYPVPNRLSSIPLTIEEGGTNAIVKLDAFNNLSPAVSTGSMIYVDDGGDNVELLINSDEALNDGQIIFNVTTGGNTIPTWGGMGIINMTSMVNNTASGSLTTVPHTVFGNNDLTVLLDSSSLIVTGLICIAPIKDMSSHTLNVSLQRNINSGGFSTVANIGVIHGDSGGDSIISLPIFYADTTSFATGDVVTYQISMNTGSGGGAGSGFAINQTVDDADTFHTTSSLVIQEIGNKGDWIV